ncbi:MAG: hypothetical protein PF541_05140 [Prolixibacteraceae bacterium]|jgi:hypothetical protein|nr:hypothetical protein [Prolixibacteraceae bacterium]
MELNSILIVIGFIALLAIEAFLEVTIVSFIGALARKIFIGKAKTFKEIYSSNVKLNGIIGILILVVVFVLVFGTFAIINN